ncbi:hypothetical protein HK105_206839 [Polyrhizophydium stewartii]|uniref:Uncharacterized protein n=1 Tax=Polyrhizophydium stewartii TaxID=2732419 RepID=A0ABR4N2F8_9FUNG
MAASWPAKRAHLTSDSQASLADDADAPAAAWDAKAAVLARPALPRVAAGLDVDLDASDITDALHTLGGEADAAKAPAVGLNAAKTHATVGDAGPRDSSLTLLPSVEPTPRTSQWASESVPSQPGASDASAANTSAAIASADNDSGPFDQRAGDAADAKQDHASRACVSLAAVGLHEPLQSGVEPLGHSASIPRALASFAGDLSASSSAYDASHEPLDGTAASAACSPRPCPPSKKINLAVAKRLAVHLLNLRLSDADATLGGLPAISSATCPDSHREAASHVYAQVHGAIASAIATAQHRRDAAATEHLLAVLHDVFQFMATRGLVLPHALTLKTADLMRHSAFLARAVASVLSHIPKPEWDERCHDWALTSYILSLPPRVVAAESRIASCVYELLARSFVSPKKIENEVTAMVRAVAETETMPDGSPLPPQTRTKLLRWTRLRLRFEETWRWYVRVLDVSDWSSPALSMDLMLVKTNAVELLNSIMILARVYGEFQYAWFQFETAPVGLLDMDAFVTTMAVCREAYNECIDDADARSVWEARAWVVYGKSLETKRHTPTLYAPFMLELVGLVTSIEDLSVRFTHLDRIYRDMQSDCRPDFFPIGEPLVRALVQQCWDHVALHVRLPEWRAVFQRIFEIYGLRRLQDDRARQMLKHALALAGPDEAAAVAKRLREVRRPFLSPETLVMLLQVCTVSGSLDEFQRLNRDLHERKSRASSVAEGETMRRSGSSLESGSDDEDADEYAARVKKGFADYLSNYIISTGGGVLPQPGPSEVADAGRPLTHSRTSSLSLKSKNKTPASDKRHGDLPASLGTASAYGYEWTDKVVSHLVEPVELALIDTLGL